MDVDLHSRSQLPSARQENAVAGPSTQPEIPVVFLPPTAKTHRISQFDSTHDLISRFHLLPTYDKYVRPLAKLADEETRQRGTPTGATASSPFQAPTPGAFDKGKGKEVVATPIAGTPGGDGLDPDDEDGGKGEKKKKNSYRHLIKGIPGKHSMKKDESLQFVMQAAPKQKLPIVKFDLKTQREAFSVSLEGLKGWNINVLVAESAQAREDRKKRKELKKLAKAQAPNVQRGQSPPSYDNPVPKSTMMPILQNAAARATIPSTNGRVPSTPQHRSNSRPPPSTPRTGAPIAPPRTTISGFPPPDLLDGKRGKKREHDEELSGPHDSIQPMQPPRPATAFAGARAGVEGARPRPIKKPRTESTVHVAIGLAGVARDVPQQQPTPQGV